MKPRITQNRTTGMWTARCEPCRLGIGGTLWPVVVGDVLAHLSTKGHGQRAVLAAVEVSDA